MNVWHFLGEMLPKQISYEATTNDEKIKEILEIILHFYKKRGKI